MVLHHRSWGDPLDRTALLVHGAVDSLDTWSAVGSWLAGQGWHAIAVDLRGHGGSGMGGERELSLETMAADLRETVEAMRPDASGVDLLVGHSLGALVSLVCVAEQPTFAARLVLEDPPGPASVDYARFAADTRAVMGKAHRDPEAFERWYFRGPVAGLSRKERDAIVAVVRAADQRAIPDLIERLSALDLFILAERCPVRTLLLLGRDRTEPVEAEDLFECSTLVGADRPLLAAALAADRVVAFEAGHNLHTEVFNRYVEVLGDWLATPDPVKAS